MTTADKKWWAKFYVRQAEIYRDMADGYRRLSNRPWTRLIGTRGVYITLVAHFENQAKAADRNVSVLASEIAREEKGWEDLGKKEAGEDA
jgi:hypothetical protein